MNISWNPAIAWNPDNAQDNHSDSSTDSVTLSCVSNESRLKGELQRLKTELQTVKQNQYQTIDNTIDIDIQPATPISTGEYTKSYEICHDIYPKSERKSHLVSPFWKKIYAICDCFIGSLLMLAILGGIITGGVYVIFWDNEPMSYDDTFNIKGTCICKTSWEKCSIDSDCKNYKEYYIDHLPVCDGIKEPGYIFNTTVGDKCTIGISYDCYTNDECTDIFISKPSDYSYDGANYMVASAIFVIAAICCVGIICYWYRCIGNEHLDFGNKLRDLRRYYEGKDKARYFETCWNEKMSSIQKLDYFISYCKREYKLRLSRDIEKLIRDYAGE